MTFRRRTLAGLLSAVILLGGLSVGESTLEGRASTPLVESHTFADADGDGKITTTDARMTLQYAADKIAADTLLLQNLDVDDSGKVDTTDARLILQAAAGKISLQPKETKVLAMSDMPGLSLSTAFSVKVRRADGGSWMDIKTFAYKSDNMNHMARVNADCEVEVQVTNRAGTITASRLEPQRYGITPTIEGNTMTFRASPMQKFAIQFSDTKTWLILAIEPFETDVPHADDANVVNVADYVTDNEGKTDVYADLDRAINDMLTTPGKDTLYFPDGIYRTHSIELSLVENVSFYFCEGARILWDENCWGSNVFRLSGCNNITFYGRGIIDATYRTHKGRGASGIGWWDGINLTHLSGRISNGLKVDGLWFFDTPNSPMRTEGGNNATFYNTKYVNYGGIMNDNLVVYGGSHVTFEEGIGTGDDDSWSAHTAAWGGFTDTRDVKIRNSTYIADGVEGRGGICYGCNESNPEGGSTWNVLYENLSLIDFGQALDSYNQPTNGLYGNFIFRNVHFETSSSNKIGFDHFTALSGTIVLDHCTFADKGGVIEGNPSSPITDLYINDLTMAGEHITSAAQGGFTIKNAKNVHWDETPPTAFEAGEVVPAPEAIPVATLPIADNFDDNTMDGWTDLSGSVNGTVHTLVVKSGDGYALKLNDTESSGVAGVMKQFTPQGAGQVVEIETDITPRSTSEIANVYINDLVGAAVTGVRFYNNGMIRYFGTKGSNFGPGIDLMNYQANVTYHLKWVIDVSAARYDLYITEGDGEAIKAVGNASFKCPLQNVASLRFDTESIWLVYAGQKTSFLADNVSVKSYPSDGKLFDLSDTQVHYAIFVNGRDYINDNDSALVYSGSWEVASNRGYGDYNNDVHYTTKDGDSVTFTFTGTGVQFLSEKNADQGDVQVYVDGVLKGSVSCYAETRSAQQVIFKRENLTDGEHTLKLVKKDGEYMLVDAFLVVTE